MAAVGPLASDTAFVALLACLHYCQLNYTGHCSFEQDTTIRTVLEYSEDEDFSDLPALDLQLDIFDKTKPLDEYGVDIDIATRGGADGMIKSGRFVFTKKRPDSAFIFPVTKQLENGVMYYFRNYKVRDGCISPQPDTFLLYPSEVETRPRVLQVRSCDLIVLCVFPCSCAALPLACIGSG